MKNQKLILSSIAVSTLLLGGAAVIPQAFAAESSTSPMSSLVEKIATRFNLNQAEVQQVFDEEKSARHEEKKAAMETKFQEKLSTAVSDGRITQEQSALITAKKDEVMTELETIKAIENTADRRAAMAQLKADVMKWAADNNIDARYILFGKEGHRGGPEGKMINMRMERTES